MESLGRPEFLVEKERMRDVNVRMKDKDNFIRFIGDSEIGSHSLIRS